MSVPTTPDTVLHPNPDDVAAYLVRTRWFGGKGRPFTITGIRRLGEVTGRSIERDGQPWIVDYLVELTYGDAAPDAEDRVELYQVPLTYYTEPERRLDHAFVGWWLDPEFGWVHAYDAVHDREAMAHWLYSFVHETPAAISFHRVPGHDLDIDARATLFTGEQSNSSVAFGQDAVLKVFRRVTPGINPDIEIHEALTRADSPDIAQLYGWAQTRSDTDAEGSEQTGGVIQLAMLQEFLRTASDGFELAKASVRDLFSEPQIAPEEAGGDFAGESARLGLTLRETHRVLAEAFATHTLDADEVGELVGGMRRRLDAAAGVVPQLAPYVEDLRRLYARVESVGAVPVQRIHGDLHLGQTLRTATGWKIVDFEGEPVKPLAERSLPDSPWRDVAGMLRSFDYVSPVVQQAALESDDTVLSLRHDRGAEWSVRNRTAFLEAYADRELTAAELTLLAAYEADKAVYETVYEARNRPAWVSIPLSAIARLAPAPPVADERSTP